MGSVEPMEPVLTKPLTLSQIHFQSILILAAFRQFTAFLHDVRESSKTKKLKFYEEILKKKTILNFWDIVFGSCFRKRLKSASLNHPNQVELYSNSFGTLKCLPP